MEGKVSSPKGTFDVLYPDSAIRTRVLVSAAQILRRYGYREIETPIFEKTDLFVRSIGPDTDIVRKEMYTFEDQGGDSLTLRPEGTAPVVRAFLEGGLSKKGLPQKFYYNGPMFRRERPQAGRYRQFCQVGAEAIGGDDPLLDAEMMKVTAEIFDVLGLKDYRLTLNSVGCRQCRKEFLDALIPFLKGVEGELCRDCQRRVGANPMRILDCKQDECRKALEKAPLLTDFLCGTCSDHFLKVRDELNGMRLSYEIDPRLVRGLDYYTRTAFEFQVEGLGAKDTVSAGGRYDDLVEELGGKPTPAVGFSLGLERLILGLGSGARENIMPDRLEVFIAPASDDDHTQARQLICRLREAGISADTEYLGRSLKAQMKHADRLGARLVVIVADTESSGIVTIRQMDTSKQEEAAATGLEDEIRERLSSG